MMELEKTQSGLLFSLFGAPKDIDLLLEQTPTVTAALNQRTQWLFEMIDWIRYTGLEKTRFDFGTGPRQVARMQYLLRLLDFNPGWKKRVAQVLRSIIHDTRGLELFMQTGMHSGEHFGAELISRLSDKILIRPPQDEELHFIFGEHIRSPQDVAWMELLGPETLSRIIELFHFEVSESEKNWNSLRADAEKALLMLAVQAQGAGLSHELRNRLSWHEFRDNPFYELPRWTERFLEAESPVERKVYGVEVEKVLEDAKVALKEIHDRLTEEGVSVAIVYKIERIESLLKRMFDLLQILRNESVDPMVLSQFIENLIIENLKRRSVTQLVHENFSVLARRIVERSGETGEKYITRNVTEYFQMIRKALGGGFITAFTTLVKFWVYLFQMTTLQLGTLAGLNYALSFLGIYFCHFTLGTKQPSMTASTLASRMEGDLEALVDEIVHLMRSQFIAVFGNVLGVVPAMMVICGLVQWVTHAPLLTPEKAHHVMQDYSVMGPTPLYAYFTGVLLWISSVVSGWAENWVVFHKIPQALAANRKLNFLIGAKKSQALGSFIRKHTLGIAANVSLGFLLGLLPSVLQYFWDIPLDVRHVTLSSGSLAAAVMSLSWEVLKTAEFWMAVGGIVSMAVLNVTVSFGLSLLVAVKARQIQAPGRKMIYEAVISRMKKKPISLIWPVDS